MEMIVSPGMLLLLPIVSFATTATVAVEFEFVQPPACRFANSFASSMVLQRNAPIAVWGWVPSSDFVATNTTFTVSLGAVTAPATIFLNGTFQSLLPARSASLSPSTLSLAAHDGNSQQICATLTDIVVGDVLLVSGQSNVGISVAYTNQFNATAERENMAIADALGKSGRVRLFTVPQGGWGNVSTPQREFGTAASCKLPSAQCGSLPWSRSNATNVVGFSALGWYLARERVALLDAANNSSGVVVPVGIVQSDIPGTPIQAWTSYEGVAKCTNATHWGPTPSAMHTTSYHWNTMIHPLVVARLAVSSIIWYQGESNVGAAATMEGAAYYACALPALVDDWRAALAAPTPTTTMRRRRRRRRTPPPPPTGGWGAPAPSPPPPPPLVAVPLIPFYAVELAAYCNEHDESTFRTFCDANTSALTTPDMHLPAMRLAQAAVLKRSNTFIVSAMDLGSLHPLPYESIHPVDKQTIARRIALAMRRVAGDATAVYLAPRPTKCRRTSDGITIAVSFALQPGSGGLALNTSAACPAVVLDVYCRRAQLHGFEVQLRNGSWSAPAKVALLTTSSSSSGLKAAVSTAMIVEITPRASGVASNSMVMRVRYAYSDWPVVALRNAVGGLPARAFDIAVQ